METQIIIGIQLLMLLLFVECFGVIKHYTMSVKELATCPAF